MVEMGEFIYIFTKADDAVDDVTSVGCGLSETNTVIIKNR